MDEHENHRILICYDDSAGARWAIETAGAVLPGRTAVVVHSWRPVAGIAATYAALPMAGYDESEVRRAALEIAEQGAEHARAAGFRASAEIAEATMESDWQAIIERADAIDAALIVLGSRGRSSVKSLILGSVSQGVLQHSHRPVMIVPPAVPKLSFPHAASG